MLNTADRRRPTLDKDELSYYRPISNLSLISKIIERVVKSRPSDHLTSNNLVNPHRVSVRTVQVKTVLSLMVCAVIRVCLTSYLLGNIRHT